MSKRYKLIKDLPDYKAGEVFEFDGRYYKAHNPCEEGTHGRWPPQYVENNPEWFSPLPEPLSEQPDKGFVWTDELVKEVVYWIGRSLIDKDRADKEVDAFKYIKAPFRTAAPDNNSWEITSLKMANGTICKKNTFDNKECFDSLVRSKSFNINSVKRLSDSEVFQIGDELTGLGLYSNENHLITSIRIINNAIGLCYGINGEVVLSHAKKVPVKSSETTATPAPPNKEWENIFNLKVTADKQKIFINGKEWFPGMNF